MALRIALIGAGGIGTQWANGLKKSDHVKLVVIIDTDLSKAEALAQETNAKAAADWKEVKDDFDAAVVAVPHKWLAPTTKELLENGKHVLCEKPAGITAAEVEENIRIAKEKNLVYMTGFNHRYHPAYLEAKKRFDAGQIGELMFIRARYGFGGRPGYEKEWRFKKEIGGGGELIDQGMHMIDMVRWFMGEVKDVKGFAENMFWGGEVEDNGFALLRTADRKVASIHVSWTNWGWVHSFEIYGKKGYLLIDGLDTRYRGPERLTIGQADPQGGKFPTEEVIPYESEQKEDSLQREADDFARAIQGETVQIPRGEDSVAALTVVEQIYQKHD